MVSLEKYENDTYHYEKSLEVFEDIDEFEKWLESLDSDWPFKPNFGTGCPIGQWYEELFDGDDFIHSSLFVDNDDITEWYQDYYWRACTINTSWLNTTCNPEDALNLLDEVRQDWKDRL